MSICFILTSKNHQLSPISMEKLPLSTISIIIFLILIIQFSSGYTPAVQYFINCGSESASSLEPDRSFVGDSPPLVVSGKPVKDNNSSASATLYQTARVFHKEKNSWYRFEIDRQGTYIVRLHFFAFSSPDADLSTAIFNVKASGFTLLSDFTSRKNASPVIEEFLLSIDPGKFFISFIPSNESSIAYVNAIEVFLAPERFIPNNTVKVTAASGSTGNESGVLLQALHKIHRINVGGSMWTGSNTDTLWRKWIEDDDFLSYPETGKDLTPFQGSLMGPLRVTEEIAPDFVYKTAKELKNGNVSNIPWGFNVAKNTIHLVRVHFCDITSEPLGNIVFNLHIYNKFSKRISPSNETHANAFPFYFDFVVESDSSGFMNISVSKRNDSNVENAFLNGLEIMKMIGNSDSDQPHKANIKHQAYIIVSAVFMLFLLVIIVALLVFFKTRKSKPYRKAGRPFSMPLYRGSSDSASKPILPPELNLELKIPYSEIQQATKNFNSKLLIGEGGFGKVYKGTLRQQGVKVAVKRSEPGHGQGIAEFQTEIIILSIIRHRHLVSLIGYCDERSEMILVYEFMEKGTLREHLYTSSDSENNSTSKSELSWEQRLKICIESAKGIHYLHTGLPNRIIHRDLKSTNILLSEDYTAKVADFGLSKSGPGDPDENTGLKGSFGYLDPEYLMTSQLTEKSDVYSFGVVLLEVLCARPAIINSGRREEVNLATWGMYWQQKGQLETIIDPGLVGSINPSSLRKFGETAEKCLRGGSSERPVMQDVIWDLEFSLGLQKNSIRWDQDDMSMTSNSLDPLALQNVERLPSQKVAGGEGDLFAGIDNTSTYTMASGVFSELGIGAGR